MLCLCKVKASARAVLTYTGEFPGDAPQKIEIVGCSDFERNNDIDLFWKLKGVRRIGFVHTKLRPRHFIAVIRTTGRFAIAAFLSLGGH
jgi:hypothetical protein